MVVELYPVLPAESGQVFLVDLEGALLLVGRLLHAVIVQGMAQTAEVKCTVMRHYCLLFYVRFQFVPNRIESWGIAGVLWSDTVNFNVAVEVYIVRWTNQFVDLIGDLAVFDADQADLANAPALSLGCFEVDGGKGVGHKAEMWVSCKGRKFNLQLQQQSINAMGQYHAFAGRPTENGKPSVLGGHQGNGIVLVMHKLG